MRVVFSYCLLLSLISLCPLQAKEVFNIQSSRAFDYSQVSSVSFFFAGMKEIDVDHLVKSIAKEKADVVITGDSGLEGAALSSCMTTFVTAYNNASEKSWLITFESSISGVAATGLATDKRPYRGSIPISTDVLVLADAMGSKEMELAISSYLQKLSDKITSANKTKPKFFVVH